MDGGWRDMEGWPALGSGPSPRASGPGPIRAIPGPGPRAIPGPGPRHELRAQLPTSPPPRAIPGPGTGHDRSPFSPLPGTSRTPGPYAGGCLGVLCFSAHEPTCLVIGLVKSTQVLNGQSDLGEKHYLSMSKACVRAFSISPDTSSMIWGEACTYPWTISGCPKLMPKTALRSRHLIKSS